MKRINILSKTVYNRIAAGEVIDRPYSAVKELVENSLDAGATDIEIYIENGGKQLIKVEDNGGGIYKDDLPAAFLPHATSKIADVDDLDNILTLGFRGEALASISAIAKVEIISVTEGNSAYRITCEGGIVGQVEPAALEKGTVISVHNLFFNTPVRAKFLKPDKKEETDITSFVARFILGNPAVRFKYYVDGKLTLQSFGGGLEEAVAQVYSAKVIPQCFKINAEKDGVHIYGFIGNQNFFKPNKSYQSLFLNGRFIVNNTISTAITNAYASYLMKRQFPFYVLNVDVPADIVDVNVHPNKADVRFIDNRFIFGAVYKVISAVLDGTSTAAEFVVDSGRIPEMKSTLGGKDAENKIYNTEQQRITHELIEKYTPDKIVGSPENFKSIQQNTVEQTPIQHLKTVKADKVVQFSELRSIERNFFDPEKELPLHKFYHAEEELKKFGSSLKLDDMKTAVADNSLSTEKRAAARAQEFEKQYLERMQTRIDYDTCKYCGSLFNTYLIYEYHNTIYIIDQHAAHERLIFDRLKEKIQQRKIVRQPLLCPYLFDANFEEIQFIEKNLSLFNELGFSVSFFGSGSFRVDEIPADLQDINIKDFFDEILSEIGSFKDIKLEEIFKDKLATTACKHAVKGGMKLTEQEIDVLFKLMDGDVGLKCPHGRPVCVTLTKRDIEKMFKRIV